MKHWQVWRDINISPVLGDSTRTVVYERRGDNWVANGDLVPVQFTGLKDKHGTDIYEGDVLRFEPSSDTGLSAFPIITYVEFADGSFRPREMSEATVIGNIYENPDLLK